MKPFAWAALLLAVAYTVAGAVFVLALHAGLPTQTVIVDIGETLVTLCCIVTAAGIGGAAYVHWLES